MRLGKEVVSRHQGCIADPGRERVARLLSDLEPHETLGLLLQNCGASSNAISMTDIAHAQIQQVARAQFAVNRQIEKREFAGSSAQLEPHTDRPDLPQL
jgi:hypothetical protein